MNTQASTPDRRPLSRLLGGLAAVAVGLALLAANSMAIHVQSWGGEEYWHREFQLGWPTTYSVSVTRGEYGGRRETLDVLLFSWPRLGVNVVSSILMLYATYAVCGRAVTSMVSGRFSLKTLLLGVTLASLGAFFLVRYTDSSQLMIGYEHGQPYLPLSGLYRWFGPGSPYEWLFHFDLMIRIPIVAGWFCTVWFACSSCWRLASKKISPTCSAFKEDGHKM